MSSNRLLILAAGVALASAPLAPLAPLAAFAADPSSADMPTTTAPPSAPDAAPPPAEAPAATPAPAETTSPPAAAAAPTPGPQAAGSVQLVPQGDVIDTLKASGQFTVLLKALDEANLTTLLKGKGPITLLAPTDAAFAAMPAGTIDNLLKPANVAAKLQPLLIYHIINTGVPEAKIKGTVGPVATGTGAPVQIDGSGSTIKFNDAQVESVANVSNGTVYAIDKVLTPAPAHAANPSKPTG